MSTEDVVTRFLACQREMYAGGPTEAVEEMLAPDVIWHVPGRSPIAGDHRGRRAVLDYFAQRRARAGGAIEITQHAQVVHADTLVQLADGHAALAGQDRSRYVCVDLAGSPTPWPPRIGACLASLTRAVPRN